MRSLLLIFACKGLDFGYYMLCVLRRERAKGHVVNLWTQGIGVKKVKFCGRILWMAPKGLS